MSLVLEVKNLKKTYGKKVPFFAVDDVSFEVKAGEILGLLGPNGSGKTTTIQMLLGTLTPSAGSIYYFGLDFLKERSKILQSVSFASTYTSLPFLLTVEENLNFFGKLYGVKDPLGQAKPLLQRFGILDKLKVRVGSLSAGQVTRLMLVKAFFIKPKIVLLDEPTASLDPEISLDVCRFLLEERKTTGLSILFTSHKMEEVTQLCDRVIVLKRGKIIANDLPRNLAKSVSFYKLHLTIVEGMRQAMVCAEQSGFEFQVDQRSFSCFLEETDIPQFLHSLMLQKVTYTGIQIVEPSLENYFLTIAGSR